MHQGTIIGVIFLFLSFCLQWPARADIRINQSVDYETQTYKKWYDAFNGRNLSGVLELGEAYLKEFPEGKFAGYVKQINGFARAALRQEKAPEVQTLKRFIEASISGNAARLKSLLQDAIDSRADVNTKTADALTALMFASASRDTKAIVILLQKGADINAQENSHGWTSLVYAAWLGDRGIVQLLLENFPDIGIKDKDGRTALDHALLTGDFEMMLLINSAPQKGVSSDKGTGSAIR